MEKKNFTKHPLSLKPGGDTLTFVYSQGMPESHGSIKYPSAYIDKVIREKEKEGISVMAVYKNGNNEENIIYKNGNDEENIF